MKTTLAALSLLLLALSVNAQGDIVPTLEPPTPVAWPTSTPESGPKESAVARIQREGRVRVGILYNAPPFGLLTIRGELAGMEADVARGMAELWGVEPDFVQVTRQSAGEMLRSGAVDYLAAALVQQADERRALEFCQSHYRGAQALMLREADEASSLAQMAGRTLGVVAGARAEEALTRWQARSGHVVNARSFFTRDLALKALLEGEIDGLVDSRLALQDILVPGELRMLDEVLEHERHALAVRPGDRAMRDLINRSLQYLMANGRMAEIHDANFPGSRLPHEQIPVWQGLGDAPPQPADFLRPATGPRPSVLTRLEQGQPLRVAGLPGATGDDTESAPGLDAWRLALAQQLELRLGVALQAVAGAPLELIDNGAADLAVGVLLHWERPDSVAYSAPLLMHGERMLVPADSEVDNFRGLDSRWLGVPAGEQGIAARAQALAESARAEVNVFRVLRDEDIVWHLLIERDLDAVFADSLRLLVPLRASPDLLKLTARCPSCDPWYSRAWRGLALPAEDPEFRRLVDAALQGMLRDGAMAQLLAPLMPQEDIGRLLLQSAF